MFVPMVHAQNRSTLRPPIVTTLGYNLVDRSIQTPTYDFTMRVDSIEGSSIINKGIQISENSNFSTVDFTISSSGGVTGISYVNNIKMSNAHINADPDRLYGLLNTQNYYYRGFAQDQAGTGFGGSNSLTTMNKAMYQEIYYDGTSGAYGTMRIDIIQSYDDEVRYASPLTIYISTNPDPYNDVNAIVITMGFYEIQPNTPRYASWVLSGTEGLVQGTMYYAQSYLSTDKAVGQTALGGSGLSFNTAYFEYTY